MSASRNLDNVNVILATDCGSTTSKARFFKKIMGEYRFIAMGEAPTTVEAPFEDVTMGVRNAIKEVEELTGHKILSSDGAPITPMQENGSVGVDEYVTTSSAGGGLQMLVTGVIKTMTAESAERAALGGGAVVLDVLSIDDGRSTFDKIVRMRHLRPDMILMAGGTDYGTAAPVIETAELVKTADIKPRLGTNFKLPIIYAGNKAIAGKIEGILGKDNALKIIPNLRPTLDVEDDVPAREAVQELFMEHVMSHAPGYDKLSKWTKVPIMPTPAGEGTMFRVLAEQRNVNVIGVGLGGATTNVYSSFDGKFVRTVSANLGMSYSICNVLKEATMENIMRWIPFQIDKDHISNRLRNKMIRPTTIPNTLEELIVEQAVAREALRLGLAHHRFLARGLRGVVREGSWENLFKDVIQEYESYIDLLKIDIMCGTGGLLSHAPRRVQSALVLMDGFRPEGVTKLYQDSVFMIPHLGVLSTVHPKAAVEIFEKDCIVQLGTCIAPKGLGKEGEHVMTVETDKETVEVTYGEIKVVPLSKEKTAKIKISPAKNFDVGRGPGRAYETQVEGGEVGIMLDARGRPLQMPEDPEERLNKLMSWFTALNAYDMDVLKKYQQKMGN